ncbi:MAG: hypothetical protein KAR73_03280 [Spirochaetales bacterium]|nr:hypothetical protein [Spirochaetales bacterium]
MRPLTLLLLLTVFLVGCDFRQDRLLFLVPGERGKTMEQRLDIDESGRYLLKQPVLVTRGEQAFYLRFRVEGDGAVLQVLGTEDREIAAKPLPGGGGATVYLPLVQGKSVRGFRVDTPAGQELQFLEAGITDSFTGVENSGAGLSLGTVIQSFHSDGRRVELSFSSPQSWPVRVLGGIPASAPSSDHGSSRTDSVDLGWQIALAVESRAPFSFSDFRLRATSADRPGSADLPDPGAGRAYLLLKASAGNKTVSFRHIALSGKHNLFLYEGLVPFEPETLRIEPLGGSGVWLHSLEVARLPLEPVGGAEGELSASVHPLPADPGTVLLYDPDYWRQKNYELFSWARFPEILIMDTSSYEVQSRFFKRLAFFVEKRGYRGRLVNNEEFDDLHGFNAHDYRAEDLARFFQAAREELFTLNPEEELLKEILLCNGIIRDEGTFSPGRGGILSISRSSYPLLRRHLLTHECYHGLFFSLPEFRQAAIEAWEQLSENEKEFWRLFFRWVGYDTEDPYLTVNEYQAYLFQQPRSEVQNYFATLTASRLISSYPGQADRVREFLRSDPDSFTRGFDTLEASLRRIARMEGGRVIELEPAEIK